MYNIVTVICVDTERADGTIIYPMMSVQDGELRRRTFWRLSTVLLCSSLRCNPDKHHILFTNDRKKLRIDGTDPRQYLQDRGVEIRYVPFELFRLPSGLSRYFKNIYYRLDVWRCLGEEAGPSIVLDSDCLWTRPNRALDEQILSGRLLLLDNYKRKDPFLASPHNLSMSDMGLLYKQIDPSYPTAFPIWYGGELTAASGPVFAELSASLLDLHRFLVTQAQEHQQMFVFSNGSTMFDNDELYTNFVFNRGKLPIMDISDSAKRMWTLDSLNNITDNDLDLTLWHLPGEKETGLFLLFNEATNGNSGFWNVPIEEFPRYLGRYTGVPQREYVLRRQPVKGRAKAILRLRGMIKRAVPAGIRSRIIRKGS